MNMNDETREEVGPNAMGNVLSSASAAVAATAVPLQKPPHSTITPPLWQRHQSRCKCERDEANQLVRWRGGGNKKSIYRLCDHK